MSTNANVSVSIYNPGTSEKKEYAVDTSFEPYRREAFRHNHHHHHHHGGTDNHDDLFEHYVHDDEHDDEYGWWTTSPSYVKYINERVKRRNHFHSTSSI